MPSNGEEGVIITCILSLEAVYRQGREDAGCPEISSLLNAGNFRVGDVVGRI